MKIEDLIFLASKEVTLESGVMKAEALCDWLLSKNKIADFIGAIKEDQVTEMKSGTGKTFQRLKNADLFTSMAGYLALKGFVSESEAMFENILSLTPNDTSALNDYGATILNKLFKNYKSNKQYDRKTIERSFKLVSKAAILDKDLHSEPLLLPAYKNLCFIRAIEAAYYSQEKQDLTAFVMAWLSVEMSVYRIWYAYLKENNYSKSKMDKLRGWKLDSIIELLFLSKCDQEFMRLKNDLDTLKGLRNDLLHGTTFEINEGQTKRCIDVALDLIPIKQK